MAKDPARIEKFYSERKALFLGVVRNAHLIGNRIGRRTADDLRIRASWLFMRACVTAHSISQLFEPAPTGFRNAVYLDHSSIAVLCRALIENIAVLLYISDMTISLSPLRADWSHQGLLDADTPNKDTFWCNQPTFRMSLWHL
jgi:hypothetical protein